MSIPFDDEFDALMRYFQEYLGIASLEKNEDNSYYIVSDDLFISFINNAGTLLLITHFDNISGYNKQEEIKNLLLEANVRLYLSKGGSFAINEEGIISYAHQYPIEALSNDSFIALIDKFIITTLDFTEKIQNIEQGTTKNEESQISSEEVLIQNNWQKI